MSTRLCRGRTSYHQTERRQSRRRTEGRFCHSSATPCRSPESLGTIESQFSQCQSRVQVCCTDKDTCTVDPQSFSLDQCLSRSTGTSYQRSRQIFQSVRNLSSNIDAEVNMNSKSSKRKLWSRPKWERCASVVEGGVERWNELSIGKTSNERVDILLNEIVGGNDIVSKIDALDSQCDTSSIGIQYNNVVNFMGIGLDSTVPLFLQTTASIPNRHFMQRDILLLTGDIWKQVRSVNSWQKIEPFNCWCRSRRYNTMLNKQRSCWWRKRVPAEPAYTRNSWSIVWNRFGSYPWSITCTSTSSNVFPTMNSCNWNGDTT